ncbi:MAG: hypothetical protein IJ113_05525 [Eggerthellaceae bacterium]|nr:hypothetical protein [Eggerthellaceae bacterium]
MKNFSNTAYVAGTAALQDRCSRYSNENERIIVFPGEGTEQVNPGSHAESVGHISSQAAESDSLSSFYETDFLSIYNAQHVTVFTQLSALLSLLIQKSKAVYDIRTYGIKGKPFTSASRLQLVGAGLVYISLALCALFIGY